jgi:hypothetical protein
MLNGDFRATQKSTDFEVAVHGHYVDWFEVKAMMLRSLVPEIAELVPGSTSTLDVPLDTTFCFAPLNLKKTLEKEPPPLSTLPIN